jgi:hypothetical protein
MLFEDFEDDMMQIMYEDADTESLRAYNLKNFGEDSEENRLTNDIITSYEVIPVYHLILLKKILEYYLRFRTTNSPSGENITNKINKNLNIVDALLNSYDDSQDKILHNGSELILHRKNSYIYTKQFPIGRLYPKYTSINRLSREFRYVLFNNVYHDIDIVNAHPTILLQYAKGRDIDVPVLNRLVYDRNELYAEIENSYKQAPSINVKRTVLSAINNTRVDYVSPMLNDLGREMVAVRSELYDEFYLNGGIIREAVDDRMKDNNSSVNSKLITLKQKLQSLYCFNEETKNVLLFKKWYESNFDSTHKHSIVPFFDGLFIKTEGIFKHDMEQLVEKYNETTSVKFAYKNINSDWEIFKDYQEYKQVKIFIQQFDTLSFGEVKQLADKHSIALEYGKTLTRLLDEQLEMSKSFTFSANNVEMLAEKTEWKYNLLLDQFIKDQLKRDSDAEKERLSRLTVKNRKGR